MNGYNETKNIATAGVFSALGTIILFLTGLVGVGTYAGPLLASFVLLITNAEIGKKYGWLCFITTAATSLFIVPDKKLAIFYICIGWYPLIMKDLRKCPPIINIILRLFIYCATVISFFKIFMVVLGLNEDNIAPLQTVNITMFILGALLFLMLDFIYLNMERQWIVRYSHLI